MQILTIQRDSKLSKPNSNDSKGIWSIWMQIRTIWKGFEPFESKFDHSNANSNHLKGIQRIQKELEAFEAFKRD